MATFSDFSTAAALRDLMQEVVRTELEVQRPSYAYGEVVSIDSDRRRAEVRYPGAEGTVEVAIGSIHPRQLGQVVRVDGRRGDRYIADVLGSPRLVMPEFVDPTVDTGGASGDGGGNTFQYVHTQLAASASWTIQHYLGGRPSVTVVDSGGTVVVGDVTYFNDNEIAVNFSRPFGGRAYLS